MFQVGDRVKKRYGSDGYSNEGTVVALHGDWIHVKHDFGDNRRGAVGRIPPRFDYRAEDLEHLNPLLRFASKL